MTEIMVSVYCLAYNHAQYIRTALDGFVNQKTDFKYEVIIHDDASTDGTTDIIREYEEKYPDIIKPIYQSENQYSQGTPILNTFIKDKIRGKYIAICEGDDYWTDENKLQMQVDILENNPQYTACVHQTQKLNCQTGEISNCSPLTQSGTVSKEDVLHKIMFQTSSVVYRREYLYYRPEWYDLVKSVGDYRLFVYLSFSGDIYYINKTMSVYRYQSCETSWTVKFRNSYSRIHKYRKERINMLKAVDEYYEGKYHDMVEKAIAVNEYQLFCLEWDKNLLKSELYKEEKFKRRLKLWIQVHVPNLIKKVYRKHKYTDQ